MSRTNNNEEQMLDKILDYQQQLHEKNQKRIRVGLKVNIFLPLIFLIISFITDSSKLIFLILWIVSLFGISGYLVYVEYSDHKAMEKLHEFGFVEENEPKHLIGGIVTEAEAAVVTKVNNFDDKVEEEQKKIEAEIKERLDALKQLKEKRNTEQETEDIPEEAPEEEDKDE